jgi:hypothetical protein
METKDRKTTIDEVKEVGVALALDEQPRALMLVPL